MLTLPGMLQGSIDLMNKTDLHPWRNAIIQPGNQGEAMVGVMNTTGEKILVRKETPCGKCQLTCSTHEKI